MSFSTSPSDGAVDPFPFRHRVRHQGVRGPGLAIGGEAVNHCQSPRERVERLGGRQDKLKSRLRVPVYILSSVLLYIALGIEKLGAYRAFSVAQSSRARQFTG